MFPCCRLYPAEFVFHKPYAMDEPESRKYCEALKQHAQLAHTRQSAYLLPLVESQHGAVVVNEQSSVVTVKLAVRMVASALAVRRCLHFVAVVCSVDCSRCNHTL